MPSSPIPSAPPEDRDGARPAGIWSLGEDGLVPVERFDVGPAIALVPTEALLLTVAALPVQGRRARAAALPFAIEDKVATPLADLHVALGEEMAPGRHLAAAVADATMARWSSALAAAGLDRAMLVPDVLALPVPPAGAWSVDSDGARALVRTDDGAGLAVPARHLEAAWVAAGRPAVIAYGEQPGFATQSDLAEFALAPLAARLARPALDLRQGRYAGPREPASPLLRRLLGIAAAGVLAHGAIAAADTLALDRLAARRATETRRLLEAAAPGAAIGDDVAAAAADLLPAGGPAPSRFLPLLGRVAAALRPVGGVTLRSMAFDGAGPSLSIEVEAADIAGLQKVGAALTAARLDAQAGSAAQDQGKAVGAFLIRGRG